MTIIIATTIAAAVATTTIIIVTAAGGEILTVAIHTVQRRRYRVTILIHNRSLVGRIHTEHLLYDSTCKAKAYEPRQSVRIIYFVLAVQKS